MTKPSTLSARRRPWLAAGMALLLIAGCQTTSTGSPLGDAGAPPAVVQPFDTWLADLRADATAQGVRPRTLDAALRSIRLIDRVLELDSAQPEFTRPVWSYLDSAISDKRVRLGREKLEQHATLLRTVDKKTGVPPEILVAFWGVESNFGENMGNFTVVDALATLAYQGRRSAMFRAELIAALKILDAGDIGRDAMLGSWAGAMGQTQFMPTAYLRHAEDQDGDGRRDIWKSLPDVFASTARYLADAGWKPGERWGEEVVLPANFPWDLAELTTKKPVADWRRLGVRAARGGELAGTGETASILLPAGHTGPAFLVRDNFRVIMRYNSAISYALAVALLSDRYKGAPPLATDWPRHEQPLARPEVLEMQQRLDALGHAAGKLDGMVGLATRTAIRGFQKSIGAVPDGFATKSVLERLRTASN
ncbi:MAG TPA: lytic murein transglycosylase [Azospirillaceae bacterium]|nr:lytic murein transglycosylase [Azospirillaceae bacterium]